MFYQGKEISFPAITQISFFKVLDGLQQKVNNNAPDAGYAKALLEKAADFPQLRTGIDKEDFDQNHEVVQELCATLFPEVLLTNEIKGIMPPFEFKPFYKSTRLESIIDVSDSDFSFDLNNYSEDQLYIFGCIAILGIYYKYNVSSGLATAADIYNKETGFTKTYRLAMNGDLMEVIPLENAVEITEKDYRELLDDYDNIDIWKKKFPPNSWLIRGIMLINLMDITIEHTLASITSDLLKNSADTLEKLPHEMRILFGIPNLNVGFLLYEDGNMANPFRQGVRNFLMEDKATLSVKENFCPETCQELIGKKQSLIITDMMKYDQEHCSNASQILQKQDVGSYILAPILKGDECLGFLELTSAKKYELNAAMAEKLKALMPIFSMAINRLRNENRNRREAIIQQQCTTIHSSVKWRFEQEADLFMARELAGEKASFNDIVFANVYPLYGQLDIKSSSERRNKAVQSDLLAQLEMADDILNEVLKESSLPLLEEIGFRLKNFHSTVHSGLAAGSEHSIAWFFEHDVHPLLLQMKTSAGKVGEMISVYFDTLHPEMHSIYRLRKNYDETINKVNKLLAALLDDKQEEAQQMFPHYFERYKTDGLEYNMYVGESISRNKKFDLVYLNNLQLWQLIVTCEMEQKFREIKTTLQSDLEIASLILVYNTPMSVQFRMDEKKFDVEGAYNARYEIVKKRIDKSHIKGTKERITQPGKIAIVYTSDDDAAIYSRYISFLENKQLLLPDSTEFLQIEDLPGIKGLKAIRVSVNYTEEAKEPDFDINKVVESVTS